ncbi:hypothetical protein F3D3_3056 [Fusibacter sp. 3D3]|nr:hypothetical protein F3D3_3056 [Fusibacter sp. 3D3]
MVFILSDPAEVVPSNSEQGYILSVSIDEKIAKQKEVVS